MLFQGGLEKQLGFGSGKRKLYISPSVGEVYFKVKLPDGTYYLGREGDILDYAVLAYGGVEHNVATTLESLARALPQSEKVFLDIGAHVGMHTLHMSRLVTKVIAIEPSPGVLPRLYEHLRVNHIDNVEVKEVGFGNQKGKLAFFRSPNWLSSVGTFSRDVFDDVPAFHNAQNDSGARLMLPIERGDDVLKGLPISLIKIDIEGFERFALEGLRDTLECYKPPVVLELNINNDGGFISKEELVSTFPSGYTFFVIDSGKGVPVVPFNFSFTKGHQQMLAAIPPGFTDDWQKSLNSPNG
jgi:FkbM family methyltransferase